MSSTIALCVTGSILVKAGLKVLPVMTASGARFVGPATLAGITGEPVLTHLWDPAFPGEAHVAIADRADLVAIVPATADVLARLAQGRADDLVAALALCARGPVVVAPAMHPRMWMHPATQRNVADLADQPHVHLVGPTTGEVASGDVGLGRMAEPDAIFEHLVGLLSARDLTGLRIVVTAGPTIEDLDPVRFLGNRSSGRMGFAVARRAAQRGADVTLIAGPVHLPTPVNVRRVDVRGALEMRASLWEALGDRLSGADAVVMAAAVADYRPAEASAFKIKKSDQEMSIALVRNPDLLAEIGASRSAGSPALVGFAVETEGGEGLVAYARRKLEEKRVDFIVANEAQAAFGSEQNTATLVSRQEVTELPRMAKSALADVLLDRVLRQRRALRDG